MINFPSLVWVHGGSNEHWVWGRWIYREYHLEKNPLTLHIRCRPRNLESYKQEALIKIKAVVELPYEKEV